MLRKSVAALAAVALGGTLLLTGCGSKFEEPYKDAPRSGTDNGKSADLVRMPDGFSNLATKCDHSNRLYVVYHGDSAYGTVAVVADDPTCQDQ
jgi:hypothetical protein